jgi:hypothetical protein
MLVSGRLLLGFQIAGILAAQTVPDETPRFQQYPVAVYRGKVSMPAFRNRAPGEQPFPDGDPQMRRRD